ncbi:hypothetical protein D4L85_21705 [Chryseolinea soli]|uniref:Uncharacterized protein n=1 Tax=Chryseolinea soli TaxID=2321403 RepID=A0A385SRU8_9BACT|nr:hypothetical protein D4L85_21705 [Chryseolinea soli]
MRFLNCKIVKEGRGRKKFEPPSFAKVSAGKKIDAKPALVPVGVHPPLLVFFTNKNWTGHFNI